MDNPLLRSEGRHFGDPASVALHGLHRGILPLEAAGANSFAASLDPVPAAAHAQFRMHGGPPGDPFDDPARPLILSIASDCVELHARTRHDLLSLSRYPGIRLALMPGVDPDGYAEPAQVTWERDAPRFVVQTHRSGRAESERLFRLFDGPAPTAIFEPRDHGATFLDPELAEHAPRAFEGDPEACRRVALEAIAHETLGNDYIVSPLLVTARRDRRMGWPNQLGACTPEEAFWLAGLKARMYSSVPVLAEPDGQVDVSTGTLRDLTAMHLTPHLARALRGSLNPAVSDHEAACAERLLAIRAHLSELLQARDAIHRANRREALSRSWARPFEHSPVSGALGNDLIGQATYHTVAALNAAYAIADNLAWVIVRRSGAPLGADRDVGLGRLVTPPRREDPPWKQSSELARNATGLLRSKWLPVVLAARRVRNAFAHREGVDYGAVTLTVEDLTSQPGEVHALWVWRHSLDRIRLWDVGQVDLFEVTASWAEYSDGAAAIITFRRFVDRVAWAIMRLADDGLRGLSWSSGAWLRSSTASREYHAVASLWHWATQRHLWSLDECGSGDSRPSRN